MGARGPNSPETFKLLDHKFKTTGGDFEPPITLQGDALAIYKRTARMLSEAQVMADFDDFAIARYATYQAAWIEIGAESTGRRQTRDERLEISTIERHIARLESIINIHLAAHSSTGAVAIRVRFLEITAFFARRFRSACAYSNIN